MKRIIRTIAALAALSTSLVVSNSHAQVSSSAFSTGGVGRVIRVRRR